MADVITRYAALLSANACTVGTAAGQISGGQVALPTVAAGFFPNRHRMGLRVTNTSSTANLFLGSTSSVTAGAEEAGLRS